MSITTLSSRDLNQDTSRAKRAAKKGPVFITDRGQPAFVLLNIDDYNRIASKGKNMVELLRMPEGTPAFDFDFEEFRPVSLSREIDLE
jgi:prevent-host-death family protein